MRALLKTFGDNSNIGLTRPVLEITDLVSSLGNVAYAELLWETVRALRSSQSQPRATARKPGAVGLLFLPPFLCPLSLPPSFLLSYLYSLPLSLFPFFFPYFLPSFLSSLLFFRAPHETSWTLYRSLVSPNDLQHKKKRALCQMDRGQASLRKIIVQVTAFSSLKQDRVMRIRWVSTRTMLRAEGPHTINNKYELWLLLLISEVNHWASPECTFFELTEVYVQNTLLGGKHFWINKWTGCS